MEGVVEGNPGNAGWINTFENLSHKIGESSETVQWEEKAITIATETRDENLKVLEATLARTEKHEPTWPPK